MTQYRTLTILSSLSLALLTSGLTLMFIGYVQPNNEVKITVSHTPPAYFIFELSPELFKDEAKAISVLDEGHQLLLIKAQDPVTGRPTLAAAKQTPTGIEEIPKEWFQPSLAFLMVEERIAIRKVTKNQIVVEGISPTTLDWMSQN